ncbi:MAG TPA: Asp-tRNA(Asn)/Glu-tRNA(Gln) amidotransferase subunit GatA [Candidatus Paceibacterota bacterium]
MTSKIGLTITEARRMLDAGEISAVDLTSDYLKKIEEGNADLNAYIRVYKDALDQAKANNEGRLAGIPLAIKDNILVKGEITSSGSTMLSNYKASYNAEVIERLKGEGAVLLGGTNMDDAAMGASTESSVYGPTRNPHDLSRVPGGSSGGSAAAVAADLAIAALGSDTGGSVRQPASMCGVVGLKPTYGAVSRYGLTALASSLDQIGSITKTVEDAELLFKVISGKDPKDSTSIDYVYETKEFTPREITVGIPTDLPREGVHEDVLKNLKDSKNKIESLGYKTKEISLSNIKYGVACYYIILPAECSANLARLDGIRYGFHKEGESLLDDYMQTRGAGFGREVRRRIMLGTYVLSAGYYDAYYGQATRARQVITRDFENAFKDVQVILMPTTPGPAFKIGEKQDPISMYLEDLFTIPANLAGVPAISVPSGTTEVNGKSLPLGVQFIAPHFREDILFRIGKDFEAV